MHSSVDHDYEKDESCMQSENGQSGEQALEPIASRERIPPKIEIDSEIRSPSPFAL